MYSQQEQVTIERLAAAEVQPLEKALWWEFLKRPSLKDHLPRDAGTTFGEAFVSLVRGIAPRIISDDLFPAIRDALETVKGSKGGTPELEEIETAAISAYILAALALVERQDKPAKRVVEVEDFHRLISAIIAAALFGGQLALEVDPAATEADPLSQKLCPSHYHEFERSPGDDQVENVFRREAFFALLPLEKATNQTMQRCEQLTRAESALLRGKIKDLLRKQKRLTFVARGYSSGGQLEAFADEFEVPVLLPKQGCKSRILTDSAELYADIVLLWELCSKLQASSPSRPHPLPQTRHSGTSPMSSQTNNFYGPVGQFENHIVPGVDLTQLVSLLRELQQAVRTNPAGADPHKELAAQADIALAEAEKKEGGDRGKMKDALVQMNRAAQLVEHGGKIIELCHAAYDFAAPLLGL
jgi:hypothetical protein